MRLYLINDLHLIADNKYVAEELYIRIHGKRVEFIKSLDDDTKILSDIWYRDYINYLLTHEDIHTNK